MAKTLYIIGNGFDLYHKLKTKYQHFAFYLKAKHNDIYEMLLEFYDLPDLVEGDEKSLWDPLWGDFENALAKIDFDSVLDCKSDYLPNYGSDDFRSRDYHTYQIEMEGIVKKLTSDLYRAFKDFILDVKFPQPAEAILLNLEDQAVFLNFNYTDTLESYYGVKRNSILYIHGRAKTNDDPTILGHGIDPTQFEDQKEKTPEGLSPEDLDRCREEKSDGYDYAFESGKTELRSYFSASYKSTSQIIRNNEAFFKSLNDIQKVVVVGHSISEVDQPYFQKIIQSIKNKDSTWIVSYYSESERLTFKERLFHLGLQENQLTLIKTEELQLKVLTLFDT